MKHLLRLGLLLGTALLALAAATPDDAKTIQGTWLPIAAELGGQPVPDAVLKTIRLRLAAGRYEVFVGEQPDRGTYTMDAAAAPKCITVTGTDGANAGKTFPAIYELTGDTLRICYDLSGSKRPAEFKTAGGTALYLVTYRRQQP